MKKIFGIKFFLGLLFIVVAFCLFFLGVSKPQNSNFVEETTHEKNKPSYCFSILKNNLSKQEMNTIPAISIRFLNSICIINDKMYSVTPTQYTDYLTEVKWWVDLSCFKICGKNEDVFLYSSDGNLENDILLLEFGEEFFLLSLGDVLNPYVYKISDFCLGNSTDDVSGDIDNLWSDHLSTRYYINTVCMEDLPEEIELKLKKHPELIYNISYVKIGNSYYSHFPYGYEQTIRGRFYD